MAAPVNPIDFNNTKGQGSQSKRNIAELGAGIKGFFNKFRKKYTLDEDVAAVKLSNDKIYDFNFDEVINLLPIDRKQKSDIITEFTTTNRQVQEYLIKQIEKRFTNFVHDYIEFKFNQLLIQKTFYGRSFSNVQLAAEEATIEDFESVLDDGVDYDRMIQPFLKRSEMGGPKYDLEQIEEALLAELRGTQNASEIDTNHLTTKQVIMALPLEADFRQELLDKYEISDDGVKSEITHSAWKTFNKMRTAMKEAKHEEFMQEVALGKRVLSSNLKEQIDDAVWQDIKNIILSR